MASILSLQKIYRIISKSLYSENIPTVNSRRATIVAWLLAMLLQIMSLPLLAADLTLEEGVVVKFGADAQLTIRDRIIAGKGIILTSRKDDSASGQLGTSSQTPNAGDCQGMRLEKSAEKFGALTLDDLTIRYGGAALNSDSTAALSFRLYQLVAI